MKLNKKQGFTLVEIMIVVAIIGLLAAIAIPSFQRSRATTRMNTCVNNLRLIDAATEQWGMASGAEDTDAPGMTDLTDYIRGGTVTCPEKPDSYTPSALNQGNPVCDFTRDSGVGPSHSSLSNFVNQVAGTWDF